MVGTKRVAAVLLAVALCLTLVCLPAAAEEGATYRFAASDLTALADKEALTGASFADSYIATFGELTKRTGSDGAVKSVEVGKNGASGLAFTLGGTGSVTAEVSSTGGSNTSTVGLWDAAGALVPNNEGISAVTGTDKTTLTWTGLAPGSYQLVSPDASEHNRGARVYSLTVEDSAGARAPRKAWSEVAAPAVAGVKAEAGAVTVSYAADFGYDGADSVTVSMSAAAGGDVLATVESDDGQAVFTPEKSGQYVFTVTALRAGEEGKSVTSEPVDFVLPLAVPEVASVASLGGGSVNVVWRAVDEATGYHVYMDGRPVGREPVTDTQYAVTGLAVGSEHTFAVTALRGEEETEASQALTGIATAEAQRAWTFATFGVSTRPEKNYAVGDLNRDGKVTVISSDGAGKILEASSDGLAFYYTAIPVDKNFTLKAHAHVNSWTNKSYQNGFGVAALDRIGQGSAEVWNNSVLVGGMRYAYYYDAATGNRYAEADPGRTGEKYTMRLGVSALCRTGVTWEGLEAMGGAITFPPGFSSWNQTLESFAPAEGRAPGMYNLIANGAEGECPDLDAMSQDFILEVQRNNTGYFASYYDVDGNLIGRHKTYDPKALDQLDSENVYVGFFTSRLMDATFDQVELTVNDPADDPAPEAKPKTPIVPQMVVHSAEIANSPDYDLIVTANVAGQVNTLLNGGSGPAGRIDAASGRADIPVKLDPGANDLTVIFTPDADQTFADPDHVLASAEALTTGLTVRYDTRLADRKVLKVTPAGTPDGDGSDAAPLDIQTAVDLAAPGQIVLVGEGTYLLERLNIRKGINGTEAQRIYLVADPAARTAPVLDFGNTGKGLLLEGNWWYLYGLDITRANAEGINIGGSHNVLDQVVTHHNLATGLQISRESRADNALEYWPSYNLILNCTAHHNVDPGYTDADGFGAKLTCGVGNVFDGCLSYRNSDDGWDLYAKAETGSIGKVVIRNCVSYLNGYLDDGTPGGDGNGFKMGGESITAYHELHDSVSFFNKNSGVTTNSCPDLQLFNVTLFDNDHLNVNFYTKLAKNTDFGATGVLSIKTSHNVHYADQFAPTGAQDPAKVLNDANYFWDGDSASKNASGAQAGLDSFVSTDFAGAVERRADGTLDLGDFLKRTDKAPAGADLGGTASLDVAALLAGAQSGQSAPAPAPAPTVPDRVPAVPVQPAQPTGAAGTYTVKKGDNLWRIAQRFYGDGSKYGLIFNANLDQLKSPDRIDIGQVLIIPEL